jgi:nidogen (entactin)
MYTLDDAWETNTEDWWDLTTTRRTWSSWRTTWTRWTISSTSTVPNMLPMDYEDPPENDTSRLYFSNQTNQTSQYEDYFQYGLNHSLVLKLRGHDDHIYSDFKIRTGFRVYNQNFTSFDIDTDGKLNFRNRATGYSLRLLPFECDIDTRFEGSILHTEINQTNLLDSIGADIRKACNGTWFNPTWAYSVTWYLVRPYYRKNGDILYGSKSNSSNTFQIVLASNGRASFALFKYVRLDWPNSDLDVTFESGYRMTDSMFGITKKIFESSNSPISKANLLNKSNMETPGTWILTFNHTRCSIKD